MNPQSPIGIFDSGIGGLTVAHAISKAMPNETLVYFGDTAHMPYGDKSKESIRYYAEQITNYLLKNENCKCIVIACNTASAAAYEYLRDAFKNSIPVINVIDPIIEEVIADDQIKRVGIIATKTTIASGIYQEKLTRRKASLEFTALATPLLAPMIEEGFYNEKISHEIIYSYLAQPELQNIDALILGCTHYPLIKEEISAYYQNKVRVIDSTSIVTKKVKMILANEGLLNDHRTANDKYYVSDYTDSFEKTTAVFFGSKIHLELKNIWLAK
ncbi:MAG: glutamate racemase [Bacteroidetes bacterium]|nr:glutamate racemase [Bacteroidota bacterium]